MTTLDKNLCPTLATYLNMDVSFLSVRPVAEIVELLKEEMTNPTTWRDIGYSRAVIGLAFIAIHTNNYEIAEEMLAAHLQDLRYWMPAALLDIVETYSPDRNEQ